jgi:hypothetical protein
VAVAKLRLLLRATKAAVVAEERATTVASDDNMVVDCIRAVAVFIECNRHVAGRGSEDRRLEMRSFEFYE